MPSFPPGHVLGSQRNGLNHTGMNLGSFDRSLGRLRNTQYPTYSDALLDWYQAKNVKSVRLMFTWEAVQPALGGSVPGTTGGYADYWADLTDVVNRLLARNIYIILAPWQFNPGTRNTDIVYDGDPFTAADFADFWGKFSAAINASTSNDQRVAFDLINEPHTQAEAGGAGVGITLPDWFTYAQAAINAIRSAGGTNTIFIPGMGFDSASSFTTNGSSTAWTGLTDIPLNNIAVTVHCYDGNSSTSTTALRNACADLVNWARQHELKVNVGEIALDAGPNGSPPFRSDFLTAQAQWADWNSFCISNNDVIVGWNWWGNSAAKWWDDADSLGGSHWGLTVDDGASQTVYMDLIEATL
jgi:endoglucanase